MIRINEELFSRVIQESKISPRKRKNYNFHTEAADTMQRMLNVLQKGSYVHPHKHENPDKREVFILLKGKILVVEFTDAGEIMRHCLLDVEKGEYGVELAPCIYHAIYALEADSIVYELKDGPYDVSDDKNFAPWAPSEDESELAKEFINKIIGQLVD